MTKETITLAIEALEVRDILRAGMILKEALAKQEQGEPVAWLGFNERGECREVFTKDMHKIMPNYSTEGMTPVYTTPQPAQKPLTDEQAMDAYCETPPFGTYKEAFIAGIRFIEAAHGIKENT